MGRIERREETMGVGPAPSWEAPLIVQVGRWDPLKDPIGVMRGFARAADCTLPAGAHLVLAGPRPHRDGGFRTAPAGRAPALQLTGGRGGAAWSSPTYTD